MEDHDADHCLLSQNGPSCLLIAKPSSTKHGSAASRMRAGPPEPFRSPRNRAQPSRSVSPCVWEGVSHAAHQQPVPPSSQGRRAGGLPSHSSGHGAHVLGCTPGCSLALALPPTLCRKACPLQRQHRCIQLFPFVALVTHCTASFLFVN